VIICMLLSKFLVCFCKNVYLGRLKVVILFVMLIMMDMNKTVRVGNIGN
jgi:hypothetical protein